MLSISRLEQKDRLEFSYHSQPYAVRTKTFLQCTVNKVTK